MARELDFGGFTVTDTTSAALTRFLDRSRGRRKLAVGFANQNFVVACQGLRQQYSQCRSVLLVNDGIGLQIASTIKYGRTFRENMNGTDFLPYYLANAAREQRIYLLGGRPEVVATAAAAVSRFPKRTVVGFCDGYSLWEREAAVIAEINRLAPDILLVGLGNPRQEDWILRHRDQINVDLVFAVGALFEWIGGTRARAPMWVRRARLEWAYRLALEPRRLLKRYTIDAGVFFWLVLTKRARPRTALG